MSAVRRVLLADDHAVTRQEIAFALEHDGGYEVCASVPDAASAIAAALELRPDVCLLDVNMPGGGVQAAWEISARLPDTHVVMLTVSADEQDLIAALRAGAAGYLLKDIHPRSLPRALDGVLAGEVALPRALVAQVVEHVRDRSARRRVPLFDAGDAHLTSREWEVVELVRQGRTTREIADRLVLSPVTVRTHLNAALKKLGFSSRNELGAEVQGEGPG